jgi:uncharacterized protein YkwD
MVRVARVAFACLVLFLLLGLGPFAGLSQASDLQVPLFTGQAIIEGLVSLEVSASPPVVQPGDRITLDINVSNNSDRIAAPQIVLQLPSSFSYMETRLPAGVTVNFTSNELSWLPLLVERGSQRLSMTVEASVADLSQPEQHITAQLRYEGQSRSVQVPVWVGLPPAAQITAEPPVAAIGQPVQLRAVTEGAGPLIQNWDFGDGRHITTPNPRIVFPSAGIYQVTLQLANPLGAATASTTVVIKAEPEAGFAVDDEKPIPMQVVQFTNESGGEAPLQFLWSFGDGTTSTEKNPAHQFPTTGYFEVRLLVQSPFGESESARTVVVGNGPGVEFLIDGGGVTGAPISAQAVVDATVDAVHWDMGDGSIYEGRDVNHVYHEVGTFIVTMTATNAYGEAKVSKAIAIAGGTFVTYAPAIFHSNNQSTFVPPEVVAIAPPGTPVEAPPQAVPTRTPPLAGELAPSPGGAGPETSSLPNTVMPQATPVPPDPLTSGAFPAIIEQPVEDITVLPEQTPLPESATPAEVLLWYINEARRIHNLPALAYNYQLSIAAQVHSEDMGIVSGVMHTGSDGSRPEDRQLRFGFDGYYAGEAVAWGWESPIPVVEFWVNSPPHRVIILNPNATHVGVGFYANGQAENIWYWAAEFGLRLEFLDPLLPSAPN